jgi:hypothetical protein
MVFKYDIKFHSRVGRGRPQRTYNLNQLEDVSSKDQLRGTLIKLIII